MTRDKALSLSAGDIVTTRVWGDQVSVSRVAMFRYPKGGVVRVVVYGTLLTGVAKGSPISLTPHNIEDGALLPSNRL